MNKKIVILFVCVLLISTMQAVAIYTWKSNPIDCSVSESGSKNPVKITFRLLAVERSFDSTSMLSAQQLIKNLTLYQNWRNCSTPDFEYCHYIHLLSAATIAAECQQYYRGTPTKSNVENEIKNFLCKTDTTAGEKNNRTVRIFYYIGHTGIENMNTYIAV